jgi:hypothetical protein
MSPPTETVGLGSDVVAIPGEHVLFRNGGDQAAELRVVRRRDSHAESDRLGLAPGDTASLPIPRGTGAVTVEVHGPHTTATTAFHPSDAPPVFGYRDGAIVVIRG